MGEGGGAHETESNPRARLGAARCSLDEMYRTTRYVRLRTRAQMVLLAAERRPTERRRRAVWCCCSTGRPTTARGRTRSRCSGATSLRREVTHCGLFPSIKALVVTAASDFFERYNRRPHAVPSIIGSDAAGIN